MKTSDPIRLLAGFSYSLYLIHFPTMLFVIALLYRFGLDPGNNGYSPSSLSGVSFYVVVFAAVMLIAWFFGKHTEGHTVAVRNRLRSLVLRDS
jgi:peptidoglycan/LPS O-acetylase OafA/YrhL